MIETAETTFIIVRHGETEWSRDRKHTSTTDLDLTERGREEARLAALTLEHLGLDNPLVISSPRQRALATAELADPLPETVLQLAFSAAGLRAASKNERPSPEEHP